MQKHGCIAVRKHMTFSAQKFKMPCVALLHSAAVCAKLKAMSKRIAIDLYITAFYKDYKNITTEKTA
jgi:hypothetical protein